MYNNRNDDYNTDIMADDTDEIQLFDEDEDIGNISDFEEDNEKNSKGKFSFGGGGNRNKEKKPLDKKNLLVIMIAAGMFLILGLLAVPGMIKKSAEKKQAESAQNQSEEQPVYTGEADQNTANGTGNLDVGGAQDGTININEPCDTVNPNNPSNINNPNCANIVANQGQNQGFPPVTGQQQAPVYSSAPPIIQEIPEPYKPEPYQPRNIQKPSSGSLNSLSGGNSSGGHSNNLQSSNNGGALTGQQNSQNDTGSVQNQPRIRPKIQPRADGVNTFSLQQGSYIPIAITTQMNSDNPSYFMAIVSENVYSKDGRHKVLIPMGSKLIGNYMALKNNNDTRMFMVVDKIILPNNRIITFDNANIIDLKGEIGAKGQLNTKFLQRLGKTLLAVSFSIADLALDYRKAKALARNSDRVTRATWEDLVNDPVDSVKDTMDVIDKSWNSVKNRIKIPIGTRLNVLTGNEIILEEYKKRSY
ncbi:MAG: TrbI/VirB10 family protein [Leptotrichiaceae bacterium]|nr:TrbI/VirB10 family protein [Leptotrichiaceae bacterium]